MSMFLSIVLVLAVCASILNAAAVWPQPQQATLGTSNFILDQHFGFTQLQTLRSSRCSPSLHFTSLVSARDLLLSSIACFENVFFP